MKRVRNSILRNWRCSACARRSTGLLAAATACAVLCCTACRSAREGTREEAETADTCRTTETHRWTTAAPLPAETVEVALPLAALPSLTGAMPAERHRGHLSAKVVRRHDSVVFTARTDSIPREVVHEVSRTTTATATKATRRKVFPEGSPCPMAATLVYALVLFLLIRHLLTRR